MEVPLIAMTLFSDREEAGRKLSIYLKDRIEVDTVVIPYPSASKVGMNVARLQDSNVVIMLSEFITSPDEPYANIGAVVEDGTIWIDDRLKNELEVTDSYIENTARIKSNSLKEKTIEIENENYGLEGDSVVIVSDGIVNGFREAAVAGSLRKSGFKDIYIAAPFKTRNTMAAIDSVADRVLTLHELAFLSSPDECYEDETGDAEKRKKKHPAAQ